MNFITSLFSNTLVAFLILVCIVVIAHELGHFLMGRMLGIGVEEFSIGFGPKIFSFKKGGTVYRVNWFLLGGYVRFYGADTEKKISPEDRERSILHAKLYKRMLVSFAGPFANFILSLVIMFFLYSLGIPKQPPVFRVLNNSIAYNSGLRSNDRVLSIDGKTVGDWSHLIQQISSSPNKPLNFEVERDGVTKTFVVTPKSDVSNELDGTTQTVGRIGVTPFFSESTIASWQGQFFSKIGIKPGDKILSVNGIKINYLDQFLTQIERLTGSNSDISLAKRLSSRGLTAGSSSLQMDSAVKPRNDTFQIEVQRNGTEPENINVDLKTPKMHAWAQSVLKNNEQSAHTAWDSSVASPELTILSFENNKENKLFHASQSLQECGLKPQDTLRKIDNSKLFSSQVDLYSWIEAESNLINKSVGNFKNNSISTNIMVTDAEGKEKVYSCFLPIRQERNELNQEKLVIDFPVKFAADPLLYPSIKIQGKNVFERVKLGFSSVISQTTFIFSGFKKLFSGHVPLSSLGGPIAIAGFAGDAAKAGFETFLLAMSLMSINIGIFNLLPLPALDGGTLLLQFVELFYRKPLSQKIQMLIARLGIAFLLTLFLFVFYNDIIRLFNN